MIQVRQDEHGAVPGADLDATFRTLWPELVRLGHLLTGSRASGEELVADAILKLLERPREVSDPRAYLRRSIVNLSLNRTRHARYERAYVATLRDEPTLPPDVDEMWDRLRALPAKQRAVLVLRYYEDLSEADIACVLGCRPGTVKSLAARGLDRLRQEIDP